MTFSLPHTCSVVACAWTYSRQHSKREQCSYKANIYSANEQFFAVYLWFHFSTSQISRGCSWTGCGGSNHHGNSWNKKHPLIAILAFIPSNRRGCTSMKDYNLFTLYKEMCSSQKRKSRLRAKMPRSICNRITLRDTCNYKGRGGEWREIMKEECFYRPQESRLTEQPMLNNSIANE